MSPGPAIEAFNNPFKPQARGRSLHPVVQSCPACGGDHKGIRAKTVHRGTLLGDENEKVYTTVGETWLCPNDTVSFLLRRGYTRIEFTLNPWADRMANEKGEKE